MNLFRITHTYYDKDQPLPVTHISHITSEKDTIVPAIEFCLQKTHKYTNSILIELVAHIDKQA